MIHPKTRLEYINDEKGYGVVATEFIPKGSITWAMDKLDRVFSANEVKSAEPIYKDIFDTYCFKNNKGEYILCWDHGRYVNHSFKSNCLTTAYDFEVAIKDILPGEELTDDYGYLNIDTPFRGIDEDTRRKVVYPDDLKKYYKKWDTILKDILPLTISVPQPLSPLISKDVRQEIKMVVEQKTEMKSVLTCLYNEGRI